MSGVVSFIIPIATHSQTVNLLQAPALKGDLAVYSLGYGSSDPQVASATLMLLLDPSLGGFQAGKLQANGNNDQQNNKQLLAQMQRALVHLMDTPNLLSDNLQLGIGQMVGDEWRYVSAKKLGSALYSHQPYSQRYKIKHFILKNQCQSLVACQTQLATLNPLSASAKSALVYAEAGAYMLGSSTASAQNGKQVHQIDIGQLTQLGTTPKTQMANIKHIQNSYPKTKTLAIAKRYAAPLYNQCSAKKIAQQSTNTQTQSSAGQHKIGNAIIIITAVDDDNQKLSSNSAMLNSSHLEMTAPVQTDPRKSMNQSLSLAINVSGKGMGNQANTTKTNITKSDCAVTKLGLSAAQKGTHSSNIDANTDSLPSYWGCIGQYAQQLRQRLTVDATATPYYANPVHLSLQTGVIAFTPSHSALSLTALPTSSSILTAKKSSSQRTTYDCLAALSNRQRNLCLLGQTGAGYGEGGFAQLLYDAQAHSFQDQAPHAQQLPVKRLIATIVQMSHHLLPQAYKIENSTPILLENPLLVGQFFTTGYWSSIYPQLGSLQSKWSGNLHKYQSVEHSQTGSNNQTYNDRSVNQAGINSKSDSNRFRNVYVSRPDAGILSRYDKANINKLTLDSLSAQQNRKLRQLILQYMGLSVTSTKVSLTPSISLGATRHSTPIMLVAKASRQLQNIEQYKKYVLYGAMDNALHLIDDATGEEILSYFPQAVLAHNQQYRAIGSQQLNSINQPSPSFGVDAPWVSYANYKLDDNQDSIASELYAFGGARLGAQAYYGVDFTGLDKVKSATQLNGFTPKQLFTITPDRLDFATPYFRQLGYSWAKPVIGHINWQGKRTLVAILSGGYDATAYDKVDGLRGTSLAVDNITNKGNAVYIVDAKTGTPLIVINHTPLSKSVPKPNAMMIAATEDSKGFITSGLGRVLQVSSPYLQNSVIGSVKALDRDADTLIDHLYFVDIQGQVFRVDIDNLASSSSISSKVRVLRLADFKHQLQMDMGNKSSGKLSNKNKGHRFYESPVVALHKDGSHHFASISIASGDQSNPLRITDPTQDIVALEVVYSDKSGAQQRIRAWRTKATEPWQIQDSQPPTLKYNQTLLQRLSIKNNRLHIPVSRRQLGTQVVATATFKSTEQVSGIALDLNISQQVKTVIDPLAPKIYFNQGAADIEMVTTQQLSDADTAANYVYTLYDKDVTTAGLFDTNKVDLKTQHVVLSNALFPDISDTNLNYGNQSSYQYQGWRAPLTVSNDHSIKAMGQLEIVANKLLVTGYNPRVSQLDPTGCQVQEVGATEIFQFCLPYGRCYYPDDSKNKNIGKQRNIRHAFYGNGIRPLNWLTDSQGKQRQLLMPNTQLKMLKPTDLDNLSRLLNRSNNLSNSNNGLLSTSGTVLTKIKPNEDTLEFDTQFEVVPRLTPLQWFDYGNHLHIQGRR